MSNVLYGTSNDETILGGSRDDIFHASGGTDRIWGGNSGLDTLVMTGGRSDYSIVDNGNGSYTLTDMRDFSPDGTTTIRAIDVLEFSDGAANLEDYLDAQEATQFGTSQNDVLLGTSGDDRFIASGGEDRIWGGTGGHDTLVLSGTLDEYEIVQNENGSYTLTDLSPGGADGTMIVRDIDSIEVEGQTLSFEDFVAVSTPTNVGSNAANVMRGTSGDDVFRGNGGDDRIWGGADGTDTAEYSGNRSDYAIWDRGDGSYLIKDLREGSPDGSDVVRNIEIFSFNDGRATLNEFIDGYVEPEFVIIDGTDGNDNLFGTSADDVLHAGGGNDRVWGGQGGHDTLILTGNLWDYVIIDNETGGAYTFIDTRDGSPDGTKVVRDIEAIRFADGELNWDELLDAQSSNANTDEYTGTAGDNRISGAHTDGVHDAHANDTIVGNSGVDWLRGGPGDDVLIGDEDEAQTTEAPQLTSFPDTDLTPFEFEPGLYQVINGQLSKLDPGTGTYTSIGDDQENYNAVGLNEADGFAYAIGSRNTEYEGYLLRIGSDGEVEPLIGGFKSVAAGTFGPDGKLYVRTSKTELTSIDVNTLEVSTISFTGPRPGAVHDLVFIADEDGGSFYGLSKFGQLVRYNLNDNTVSEVTIANLDETGPFGAGWTAADGGLYFADNSTGNIYGISGIENGQPTATLVAVGGQSSINDGFSYGGAPLPESFREAGGDHLLGGSGNDRLFGGAGDDFLDGGRDADELHGGTGLDTADYSRAEAGVTVNLETGGTGGEANGDTYYSIERVEGSGFNDNITGDAGANILRGREGDDSLNGGDGNDILRGDEGADALDGGDGFDIATYYHSETGVTVDLESGVGNGGDAAGDILRNIEAVQGSNFGDDVLWGSSTADQLFGFGGDDQLSGRGGNDTIHGGIGNDIIDGGDGNDFLLGQDGNDTVAGGLGEDNVQGGDGNDSLYGDDGDDRLFGGDGNDVLIGGTGDDNLRGAAGDDLLKGGLGADRFHFSTESDNDIVADFELGIDSLDFTDIQTVHEMDDLQYGEGDSGLVISGDGFSVVLTGYSAEDVSEIDFVFADHLRTIDYDCC